MHDLSIQRKMPVVMGYLLIAIVLIVVALWLMSWLSWKVLFLGGFALAGFLAARRVLRFARALDKW